MFSNKEDGVLSGDLCKDCFDEICEKHHSIIIEDEVVKKTNELYGLYDALDECREYYDIFSNKEDGVLSGDLCKDCFDEICEKHHSIIIEDEVVYEKINLYLSIRCDAFHFVRSRLCR